MRQIELTSFKIRRFSRSGWAVPFLILLVWAALILGLTAVQAAPEPPGPAPEVPSSSEITDSIVQIGGDVEVPANLIVQDDVVAVGGDVHVSGTVHGDAVAVLGSVTIDGEVRGNVTAVLGDVNLQDGARVDGEAVSVGGKIKRAETSRIRGKTTQVPFSGVDLRGLKDLTPVSEWWLVRAGFKFLGFLGSLALAFLIMAFFPLAVEKVSDRAGAYPARSALVGFLTLLAMVPAALLLIVTIIGIPLIPVVILAVAAAKLLGWVGVSVFTGGRLAGIFRFDEGRPWLNLLLGAAAIAVAQLVPVLGWLISLALTLIGIGAAVDTKFGTGQPWFPLKGGPGTGGGSTGKGPEQG
ncbi:MAG: polymer-forming cytoskeletal protein [Firmicutes bacterium]|nr:polymer-forming cytoskeletal protein [Bacillota bacterium]